jgi:uncharacterized protein (DUF3084 family)
MPSIGKTILDGLLLGFIVFTIFAAMSGDSQDESKTLETQLQAANNKIAELMTEQKAAHKTIATLKSNLLIAQQGTNNLGKQQEDNKRENQSMVYVQSH